MKSILKYSSVAIAMLLANQASAVDIVITGSTAFRSATHSGITAMMGGSPTIVHAHASSLNSANQATFKGVIPGVAGTSYIFCSWSGSATGVIAVANGTPVNVISQTIVDAATQNVTTPATAADTTATPRMAFSDVYKESTSAANASLTDSRPAVIPFRFVRNKGSSASITNVTAQNYRALYNGNNLPLSFFTDNPADTDYVIGVGRNNGSGTRITVMAETKYGIGNPVQQWKAVTSGATGSGSVTSAQIWAVGDGTGSEAAGNGGFSSGSNIASLMGFTSSSVTLYEEDGVSAIDSGVAAHIIGYAGISDSNTAVTNGGVALSYEGVTYSADAVYNGQYTLWGYLHLYYPTLTTDETTFRTNLNTQLANGSVLGTNGLLFNSMNVSRAADGGIVGF